MSNYYTDSLERQYDYQERAEQQEIERERDEANRRYEEQLAEIKAARPEIYRMACYNHGVMCYQAGFSRDSRVNLPGDEEWRKAWLEGWDRAQMDAQANDRAEQLAARRK